jgi:hypothetical protein
MRDGVREWKHTRQAEKKTNKIKEALQMESAVHVLSNALLDA